MNKPVPIALEPALQWFEVDRYMSELLGKSLNDWGEWEWTREITEAIFREFDPENEGAIRFYVGTGE